MIPAPYDNAIFVNRPRHPGAGNFDGITSVIQADSSSVQALNGATEEEQFPYAALPTRHKAPLHGKATPRRGRFFASKRTRSLALPSGAPENISFYFYTPSEMRCLPCRSKPV